MAPDPPPLRVQKSSTSLGGGGRAYTASAHVLHKTAPPEAGRGPAYRAVMSCHDTEAVLGRSSGGRRGPRFRLGWAWGWNANGQKGGHRCGGCRVKGGGVRCRHSVFWEVGRPRAGDPDPSLGAGQADTAPPHNGGWGLTGTPGTTDRVWRGAWGYREGKPEQNLPRVPCTLTCPECPLLPRH